MQDVPVSPDSSADMEELARVSGESPRDEEAERAFIEAKIEAIRTDATLSDQEKDAAIRELEETTRGLPPPPGRVG